MDRVTGTEMIEREIEAVMRERGIDRGEAEVIVGMRHGELSGDILFVRRLTDDQRRRRRRTLREVMAERGELTVELTSSTTADG